MCSVKTQKHLFPFIITFTIVPNDTRIYGQNALWSVMTVILDKINVQSCPQNTGDQQCFSIPCLFVLISSFQTANRKTNIELRTMSYGKMFWFHVKKG